MFSDLAIRAALAAPCLRGVSWTNTSAWLLLCGNYGCKCSQLPFRCDRLTHPNTPKGTRENADPTTGRAAAGKRSNWIGIMAAVAPLSL